MFQRRSRLTPGDPAPDPEVRRLDGEPARLLGLRGPRRTAFVFVRHFG